MTLWFTSDTHFGHANIIHYSSRPFTSVEEMDETLVARWNEVVKPSDHVYHLGDVSMKKKDLQIVTRLNGKKRLVRGNHDVYRTKDYLSVGFQEIYGIRVLDNIIFTHIPIHPGSMGRFLGNAHGHTHQNTLDDPRYVNVCVEQTDYYPVTLESVVKRLKETQDDVQ